MHRTNESTNLSPSGIRQHGGQDEGSWDRASASMTSNDVAIVVPTLNAGSSWIGWMEAFDSQTLRPRKRIVIDSGSTDQTREVAKDHGFTVVRIPQSDFHHARTRQLGVELVRGVEFVVFMTQDALLASNRSLDALLAPFSSKDIAISYGRQLPQVGAGPIEAHARLFNYPETGRIVSIRDAPRLGIRCAFNSDSFSAYRIAALDAIGGFAPTADFGEDSVAAAMALKQGWRISYTPSAQVRHSHGLTVVQEAVRYVSIGRFHGRHRRLFSTFGAAEGSGAGYLLSELSYVGRCAPTKIPMVLLRSLVKYSSYRYGRFTSRCRDCSDMSRLVETTRDPRDPP